MSSGPFPSSSPSACCFSCISVLFERNKMYVCMYVCIDSLQLWGSMVGYPSNMQLVFLLHHVRLKSWILRNVVYAIQVINQLRVHQSGSRVTGDCVTWDITARLLQHCPRQSAHQPRCFYRVWLQDCYRILTIAHASATLVTAVPHHVHCSNSPHSSQSLVNRIIHRRCPAYLTDL